MMKKIFASTLLLCAFSNNLHAAEKSVKELCFSDSKACFLAVNDENGLTLFTSEQYEPSLYQQGDALPENFEFQVIPQQQYALLKESARNVIDLYKVPLQTELAFSDCDNDNACDPGEIVKEGIIDGVKGGIGGAVAGGIAGATGGTFTVPGVGTVTGGLGGLALGGTVGFIGGMGGGICGGIMSCILQNQSD